MRFVRNVTITAFVLAAITGPTYGGPVQLAPNDDCPHAEGLLAGDVREGNDVLALDDYAARDGSGANAQDVVFTFELPGPAQVVVGVAGSDYQIDLYIRRICEDPATEVAFVSRTTGKGTPPFDAILEQPPPAPLIANLPGGRYYLFLDADNGAGVPYRIGSYRLSFEVRPPARGDGCEDPIALPSSGTLTGSTAPMFDDYRSPAGGVGGKDIAFAVASSEPKSLIVDPGGTTFDTVLYARTDCDDPATEFASADDDGPSWQGALELTVPAGTSFVILDGWDRSQSGAYKIRVR